jgi:anti-sigma factor RsiW
MQKPNDELLIAYIDGEIDDAQAAEIERWIEADAEIRDRLQALTESAALLRHSFDAVLQEEIPQRLIAAARGLSVIESGRAAAAPERPAIPSVIAFLRRRTLMTSKWWIALPVAASVFGLTIGTGVGYLAAIVPGPFTVQPKTPTTTASTTSWLDNVAGYHKLFVTANGSDKALFDVPAEGGGDVVQKISQRLPGDLKLPDLKPWGLKFEGARLLIVEARPAAQLFYSTDNKAIGPITLVVASSKRQDAAPAFDHRQDVNLLYWRHHGKAYALVGQADIGTMWGLANDIAWQLDAI